MARQPATRKCCSCVPLRPGLLAWAYIRLVIILISIGVYLSRYEMRNFVDHFNEIYTNRRDPYRRKPADYVFEQLWPLGVCLLYLVFSIIFIIGVRRENIQLLQVFQLYSIYEAMLAAAVVVVQLYDLRAAITHNRTYFIYNQFNGNNERFHESLYDIVFYLGLILPVVINIMLPIYFIVLIKSEVQRLKRARGETRVVLDATVTKEPDRTNNFVYTNETPARRQPLFPVEELERLRLQLGVKNV